MQGDSNLNASSHLPGVSWRFLLLFDMFSELYVRKAPKLATRCVPSSQRIVASRHAVLWGSSVFSRFFAPLQVHQSDATQMSAGTHWYLSENAYISMPILNFELCTKVESLAFSQIRNRSDLRKFWLKQVLSSSAQLRHNLGVIIAIEDFADSETD